MSPIFLLIVIYSMIFCFVIVLTSISLKSGKDISQIETPKLKRGKNEMISYTLSIIVSFLILMGRPMNSLFLLISTTILLGSLLLINIRYLKLYNKAVELLDKQKADT